jgi:membrane fusion protein, multidrug efflux system
MDTTRKPPAAVPGAIDGERPSLARRISPRLRLPLIILGIIVLIIVLIAGGRFLAYAVSHQTTDDAMIDTDQVQITSKIAERVQDIYVDTNQLVQKGELMIQLQDTDERTRVAQAEAAVDSQQAQARAAQENVALTRDTQQAQNVQNSGAIAQASAGIASANAAAASSEQQIAASRAALATALAQLKSAQSGVPGALQNERTALANLRRTVSLVSTGDNSQAQLDAARAQYESMRSSYAQALANVIAARASADEAQQKLDAQAYSARSALAQVGTEQGMLATARGKLSESAVPSRVPAQQAQAQAASAQIASLGAQLRTARDQLSYTQIRAPAEGYVGQKNVERGQYVQPGQVLMTVIPVKPIYITANYKETQIGRMRDGQPVDIHVDAYSGVTFKGHIENLSPASQNEFSLVPPENATGNFVKITQRVPVRIVFDNPDPKYPLRPGMSVETSVKVK